MTTTPVPELPTAEKLEFYHRDRLRHQTDFLGFRCPKPLAVGLRSRALAEQVDVSALIRRLLTKAAHEEGIPIEVGQW
jgi:hypothetical protein